MHKEVQRNTVEEDIERVAFCGFGRNDGYIWRLGIRKNSIFTLHLSYR